ncbi:MAG: acylase [Gammaproteobacteria bacterium]|nr:acylase [Gammaproteobacteria bacterium]
MSHLHWPLRPFFISFLITTTAFTSGCPQKKLTAFDEDGILEARVRRTDFGVPHIQAGNLESLGFGVGYAFAQDNACVLADIIMKYNSRRARYLGPDRVPGSGDGLHLINDFGFMALEVRAQAEASIDTISANQHALISGYTKGYNHYLEQTGVDNIDPACAGKPWVHPITEVDMLTSLLATALLPGSNNFLAAIFVAAPPGQSFAPFPASAEVAQTLTKKALSPQLNLALHNIALPKKNPLELGSNAWAIGADKSARGRGLLLANPHFPHTGILRFWQLHTTIPGVLDVMGSALAGTPGIVNIGFNEHLAWTHTFSTAEHVIAYQLELDPADTSGLTYRMDGAGKTIQRKTLTVDVAVTPGVTVPFSKHVYYSEQGPLFVAPGQLPWGTDTQGNFVAFALKDANRSNLDIVDHWLGLNLARNLNEFRATFKQYNGVIFNNTLATDADGNAFYIDDSTVPQLSATAEQALRTNPLLVQLRKLTGFSILPGNSALFDFSGPVPYENAPRLERRDFVQNSNDSYWLTNPAQPISGPSILYGGENKAQTLRSRMGQKMLQDAAGNDGKFSAAEVEAALFSQRSYLAENVLEELLVQCQSQGDVPVLIKNAAGETLSVNIADTCAALTQWDGHFHRDSRGAHAFREFAEQFAKNPQWAVPFDANQPTTTPNTLLANEFTLQQLAAATLNLQAADIAPDAELGDVQFIERANPDGSPGNERLPFAGSNNIEGGFNVFRPVYTLDGSTLPRHLYKSLPGTQLSAEAQGYPLDYGSSWMMVVEFTRKGPKARGLMTYSQSVDTTSPHALDQSRLYSAQPRLQPIPFRERDIAANTQSELRLRLDIRAD